MSKAAAVIVGAVLAVVSVAPATADTKSVTDGEDTGDVMDLAIATHGHPHRTRPNELIHRIGMHQEWENSEFQGAHIKFWLPDRDRAADRTLVVLLNRDGSLKAAMTDSRGRLRGYVNAYRSSARALSLEFPVTSLRRGLDRYRWKAFVKYNPCRDRQPNEPVCTLPRPDTHKGRVLHEL